MITKQKTYALCMFAHSRLSGKTADTTTIETEKMIIEEDESILLQKQVDKYIAKLEAEHLTVDKLNMLPDNLLSKQLTYYYEVGLKVMNKYVSKGDEIVEAIIGLSILAYLEEEKQIVSSDVNTLILIDKFETLSQDRKLNTLMLKVGAEIVEAVDKANYIKWMKARRKNYNKKVA